MFFKKKFAGPKMKARVSDPGGVKYIVVGLGNPGANYVDTRHNAGFIAMDYISSSEGFALKKIQFKSLTAVQEFGGEKVLFLKPQTFMNLSGEAVMEAMRFYKVKPERVLILVDDVYSDVGEIRIRRKGSAGGQNGLKSIFYLSGTDEFPRIRIGVGKKPHADFDLADWVLSKFTTKEIKAFQERFEDIKDATRLIVAGDLEQAMNLYTGKKMEK